VVKDIYKAVKHFCNYCQLDLHPLTTLWIHLFLV